MEITLKEKFVLLALDDTTDGCEKGSFQFEAGLLACIILEMVFQNLL